MGSFPHDNSKRSGLQLRLARAGINYNQARSLERWGLERRPTMPAFDAADTRVSKHAHCASKGPIMISQNDARQGPSGHRMLYVLGFGLAGAILSNMLVFIYFAMFYASG